MRLIYSNSGREVKVGDIVQLARRKVEVIYFSKPHKPSSSGQVSVRSPDEPYDCTYYVGVIGAKWIEREDQD